MDAQQFDALTRSLCTWSTRRAFATGLIRGLLAALPFTLSGATVEAKKKKKSKKKKKRSNLCVPSCGHKICGDDGCGGSCGACAPSKVCAEGHCVCPAGTTECGGTCVNTAADPRNCGSCGKRCQIYANCVAGVCTCSLGTCAASHASCCASGQACFCLDLPAAFLNPTTCASTLSCPPERQCVGSVCKTCCPVGSTCDPVTHTCLQ